MIALTMQRGAEHALAERSGDETLRAARKAARKRVNHRIAFMGHAVAYAAVILFLAVVAGLWVALIVALSWGIGLASHGFWGVVAPELRERWVADEVGHQVRTSVVRERRAMGNEHARDMHRLSAAHVK